ncbi:MAG: SDR family oxidoreductase [Calditrichaeota bacterium]|nr:SDR family oxidoreductase [Calditrichota bacterium]
MRNLQDKIVWITGSGRGIGRAAAMTLAREGAKVVVSARTGEEIKTVVREIESTGGQAIALVCDVTKNEQISNLVEKVKAKWGPIDILINNAGIGIFKKISETTKEDWETMMDVNLKGAFLCSHAVLPDMIEKKAGHIINVVSVAGKQAYYSCGGYCASKYGLLGFTDVLRLEMRKHGIKVTAFLPGATDTAIWGDADVDRSKMMTPEQVAEGIVSICYSNPNVLNEEIVMRPIGGDL